MSGVDLIGSVPARWRVKPLRLVGRLLKGTGGSKEDVVENGVPCVRYGDLYTTHNNFIEHARTYLTEERALDYTPIEYGDVLFAASGETIEEIGKSAVNLLHGARCGGDLVILRPTEPTVPRFLGYATDAAPVAVQKSLAGRGTTVKHIYPDELREVVIAVPPIHEQQAIADFLDRETARLDHLAIVKRRLLNLLAEKRKAIIAAAVTRGLDPNVKLRDSGVPWLGEIPAHWTKKRLRHISPTITVGVVVNPSTYVTVDGVPFLYGSDITEEGIRADGARRLDPDVSRKQLAKTCLRPGDVVTVRVGAPGVTAVVPPELDGSNCASVMLVRGASTFDSQWLAHAMNSPIGRAQVEVVQYGAAQEQFNISHAVDFWFAVPPLEEQRSIVAHIARETAKLDAVRAATERTIALLKERRSALIAAAVTGQLDVGAAA